MKYRYAYLSVLTLLLLTVPVTAQTTAAITESQVMNLMNIVDKASRQKNVAAMTAPLARDVKIKLTVINPSTKEERVMSMTRDQYAFYSRQAFRVRFKYSLERRNTRVKIYEDGKTVMVTSDVYETVAVQQGTLRTVTSEVDILTLREGKLLFTSIDARVRFY